MSLQSYAISGPHDRPETTSVTHQPIPVDATFADFTTMSGAAAAVRTSYTAMLGRIKRRRITTFAHPMFPDRVFIRRADLDRLRPDFRVNRRPLPSQSESRHAAIVRRLFATGQYATADAMRDAGWAMSYELDGYGRLFGRWPEGTDPTPLVPVRDNRAA